jgi:tetratricopeptide (TPR) repeat protein
VPAKRYSAFISYNHRDRGWAVWLHRGLERYRIPKKLRGRETPLGTLGKRLEPVFRDRDELAASADLAASVEEGLSAAATLIVVCSPHAARSHWVNEEIRTFIRWGRQDRIRLIIVDGQPNSGDPETECMPPALKALAAEPLAADARKGQDGRADAKLKILAGVMGVSFDELRQREAQRRTRRLTAVAAASVAGFLLMGALASYAWMARNEAIRQRAVAEQRTLTSERTLDFVKSMFRVSDPSEARGETITAREVVDRGAIRLQHGLRDQPAARADLTVTLAEVYGSLGLLQRSRSLIRDSFSIPHGEAAIRVRQLAALAETQSSLGEYEPAIANFHKAAAAAVSAQDAAPGMRSRILAGLAQAHSALGDRRSADEAARKALQLDRERLGPRHQDVARDLEILGLNAFYDDDLEGAQPHIEQALAMRLALEGPNSPSVNDNRNTLASMAFMRGDLRAAERYFRANLVSDERVLGPNHPDLAATLNNLGRVILDQRRFAAAARLIERAIAINLAHGRGDHDDMAFLYSNLGIAHRHLGRDRAAEAMLERGLAVARAHEHRTLGPILADLAELRCRTGRIKEGLTFLAEAEDASRRDYPDDPWRSAWVENIRGECLIRLGRTREGKAALARSTPLIRARWPESTLYGGDAALRWGIYR